MTDEEERGLSYKLGHLQGEVSAMKVDVRNLSLKMDSVVGYINTQKGERKTVISFASITSFVVSTVVAVAGWFVTRN